MPGTQTALYAAIACVAEAGNEVIVGDPMYASYEGVVRACGANMVAVPLRAEHGFWMQAVDIAERVTDRTRASLLITPHNPTGAILSVEDYRAIGELAQQHGFWIVFDEVYADLVFDGEAYASGLSHSAFVDRVVVVSSISKSHAAPGFRSGWCVGPKDFVDALLPFSEAMLVGNQPFIADMTAKAAHDGSAIAPGMRQRFAARAKRVQMVLGETAVRGLRGYAPTAGRFAILDGSGSGLDGDQFAAGPLEEAGVSVMLGSSFGESLKDRVRTALTVQDDLFDNALDRVADFSQSRVAGANALAC